MSKTWRFLIVLAALGLIVAAVTLVAPVARSQSHGDDLLADAQVQLLSSGGSYIGVSLRDIERDSATREKRQAESGVIVEEVRKDSPAAQAGLREGDVVVEFDGERVRSARQLARLVEETPPGRPVKTVVQRDGQRVEVSVTPERRRHALLEQGHVGEIWRDVGGRLGDFRLGPESFDFEVFRSPDFEVFRSPSAGRLGVTVTELTPQLATYFGAKRGVLVTSVSENTPAARAGLRAGDVLTSIGGESVEKAAELRRELAKQEGGQEFQIGVVRDKKEMTLKVTLEELRRRTLIRRTI